MISAIPRSAFLHVTLFALFLTPASLSGQSEPSSQPAPTTSGPAAEVPKADEIQARIKQIQEQTDLADEVKATVIEQYNQAMADLSRAAEWNARIADFEKQRSNAKGTAAELMELTSRPIPEPQLDVAPNATLQDLEKQLAQAQADLKAERDRLAAMDAELKARPERIKSIPDQIARARKELDELSNALAGPPPSEEPPEVAAARRIARLARARALDRELAGLKADLDRTDFLVSLRDWTQREVAGKEKLSNAWENLINERRRAEVEEAAVAAKEVEKEAEKSHPIVAALAKEIADIVKERGELAGKLEQVRTRTDDVTSQLKQVRDRAMEISKKVQAAGLNPQLAMVLRRYREQLPNVRDLRRRLAERREELARVEARAIELRDLRESSGDLEVLINERVSSLDPRSQKPQRVAIKRELRELFKSYFKNVADLEKDYDAYFNRIGGVGGLVDQQQELVDQTESFASFINERILWIRSSTPPEYKDIERLADAFAWLTNPANWAAAWNSTLDVLRENPVESAIGLILFTALVLVQPRIRRTIREKGETVSKSYAHALTPTIESFLLTLFAALPWPMALWVTGSVMGSPYDVSDFVRSVARGLQVLAVPFFAIELLRQTCRQSGLADAHYHWPARVLRLIRQSCGWLIILGAPAAFVSASIDWTQKEPWIRSLGRLAFDFGGVVLFIFLWRVLHPHKGVLRETAIMQKPGWRNRLSQFAFYAMALTPLILVALSLVGYHYTAVEILIKFNRMIGLIIALVLLYGLGLRWLLISRRRLAIEQARQRRAALEAQQITDPETASDAGEAPPKAEDTKETDDIDLTSLNEQTQAILRGAVIISFIVGFWLVWVDVIPALRIFDRVQLWSTTVSHSEPIEIDGQKRPGPTVQTVEWITLTDLGLAVFCLLATVAAARNLPGLLEIGIMRRTGLGPGERYAISTVSRYIITFLGLLIATNAIGIGWAQVQWLAAAMTVGLGFGLQEIFANFVSGLIILFERPIRVGDIVTVSGVDGRVTRIQMRATTIMNWDRKELIIPNKEFVTGQVINWTLSDEVMRIVINVGIAYGSDVRLARDLMMKVVTDNRRVMTDPGPRVIFSGFGASSLDMQLRCFVASVDDLVDVRDELHYQIDDAFRKAGIEIAFPQLDLHLRDVPATLESAALKAD
ncbi:MAG: mechanosensitive ion channel [Phycisphaerae bacterium]|nr:mechanosensitive ion channel [Phycisphaerae bacterium]